MRAGLFVLMLGAYAYFYQGGGWNQNCRFDLVRSLVERGALDIDPYHRNTGDKAQRDGHWYCEKAPGASLLGAPAYAVQRAIAPPRPDDGAYVATLFGVGIPSAVGVVFLYMLLGTLGLAPVAAVAVSLAYGLGTLVFPYSTILYGHVLLATATLGAMALLARRPASIPALLGAGAFLGSTILVEYQGLLVGIVLSAYALYAVRPWHRLAWVAAGGVLPLFLFGVYHAIAFGGPATLGYAYSAHQVRHAGPLMGLGWPNLDVLVQILFLDFRGLFFSAPWLLLGVPGIVGLIRRAERRPEGIVCAAGVLLFVWLNAALIDWQGGWGMGPRFLIPAIPFLAAGAAGLAWGRPTTWVWFVPLAAVSFALQLVGTAVKPEVPIHIVHPFQEFLIPAFLHGKVGWNAQSIDALTTRGATVAWNLGQKLGLAGVTSLLPLVVWIGGLGGLLVRRARSVRL